MHLVFQRNALHRKALQRKTWGETMLESVPCSRQNGSDWGEMVPNADDGARGDPHGGGGVEVTPPFSPRTYFSHFSGLTLSDACLAVERSMAKDAF